MAITRTALGTGANNKSGGDTLISVSGISVGDLIVVLTSSDAGIAAGGPVWDYGTDNRDSITWTQDALATNAGNVVTDIWTAVAAHNSAAGARIIVPGWAQAGSIAAAAIVIKGQAAAPAKDASSAGTGSGTTPSSGASGTTAQADEICIGAIGTEGPEEDADGTWSNSFSDGQHAGTTGQGATSNVKISEGYRIVSSAAAYTAAKASITSRDWAAAIVTYKAAPTSQIKAVSGVVQTSCKVIAGVVIASVKKLAGVANS